MEKKITIEELKKSSILRDFISDVNEHLKGKARNSCLERALGNIIGGFTCLKKIKKYKDPARDYLKKLEGDYRRLDKMETHRSNLEGFRNLIEIEIKVGKEYIRRFRSKGCKEYYRDFLFLELNNLLRDLKYKTRIEIISGLCVFFKESSAICYEETSEKGKKQYYPAEYEEGRIGIKSKGVEKARGLRKQCEYFDDRSDSCFSDSCFRENQNTEQRLKRARKLFPESLRGKRYKEYEGIRIAMIREQIEQAKAQGRAINPSLKSESGLKKCIRDQYIESRLKELLKKDRKKFRALDLISLFRIIKSLKIPKYKKYKPLEILSHLEQDVEFLDAFMGFPAIET